MWKRMKFLKGENCSLVTEKKSLSTSVLTGKTKESGFTMLHIKTTFLDRLNRGKSSFKRKCK